MNIYRLNSVGQLPGRLPVLISAKQSKLAVTEWQVGQAFDDARPAPVRQIGRDALALFTKDRRRFEQIYGVISDRDREKLLGLLLLTKALADKDPRTLELAIQRTAKGTEKESVEKVAGWVLAGQLAKGLRGAELILWTNKDGSAAPGLRCDDILSALYVLAVLQFGGGVGLGSCIMCGNPFVQERKTRKTCSDTCRYKLHMQKKAMHPRKRRKS